MIEAYKDGVGVTAGSYMIKWAMMDMHVRNSPLNFVPGDQVNVFINFECILKNLASYKPLMSMVNFHKQRLVIELESSILNLVGNYRSYFRKERCIPKVFLYYTDINTVSQQMSVYNPSYRNYYHNRYTENPAFRQSGEVMSKIIIPEVKLILQYVPDCYFLQTKSYDGSVIPIAVSEMEYGTKNMIITGDVFDTLYLFRPNFSVIYIKRDYKNLGVTSDISQTIQSIVKNENPFDLTIFNSEMYYRLLLAIKGSKIRNIKSAKGFGYGQFMRILKNGIDKGIVLSDFSSLDSIIELFPEKYRDGIKEAFQCTDIDTQYMMLSDTDKEELKSQIVDKTDIASIEALNNRRFADSPINLQMLIG